MRYTLLIIQLLIATVLFGQRELRVTASVGYAPTNFIAGNPESELFGFYNSFDDALVQSPIYTTGIGFTQFVSKSHSIGVGLDYLFVRVQAQDFRFQRPDGSSFIVRADDFAIRNYFFPNVSWGYTMRLTKRSRLAFMVDGRVGLPFSSYDMVEDQLQNNNRVERFTGDNFSDGVYLGGGFSCMYVWNLQENYSKTSLQVGPHISVLDLGIANDVKYIIGVKVNIAFVLE